MVTRSLGHGVGLGSAAGLTHPVRRVVPQPELAEGKGSNGLVWDETAKFSENVHAGREASCCIRSTQAVLPAKGGGHS